MKKSTTVVLTLLPAFAAAFLAGCDESPEEHTRACLDPQGQVVDAKYCEDMYANNGVVVGHSNWFYYWYYSPGRVYYRSGSRVIIVPGRGSFNAPSGSSFGHGSSVGVVRGGFGATGAGGGS